MIRQIVKDVLFLEQKSEPATIQDKSIVTDLVDTLKANLDGCVGLAANMIGFKKRILVFTVGAGMIVPMINPVILKKEKPYLTEESCLSLEGFRQTTRYETIEVKTPFGALKTCESAIIKVESSKAFDVCSIKLIIEKEDENLNPVLVRELELQQSGENEKVREYSVEISPLEQPARI